MIAQVLEPLQHFWDLEGAPGASGLDLSWCRHRERTNTWKNYLSLSCHSTFQVNKYVIRKQGRILTLLGGGGILYMTCSQSLHLPAGATIKSNRPALILALVSASRYNSLALPGPPPATAHMLIQEGSGTVRSPWSSPTRPGHRPGSCACQLLLWPSLRWSTTNLSIQQQML